MRVRPARAARARGVDRAAADRGRSAAAAARASSRAGERVRRRLVTPRARVPVPFLILCMYLLFICKPDLHIHVCVSLLFLEKVYLSFVFFNWS